MKEKLEEAMFQIASTYEALKDNESVDINELQNLVGALNRLKKVYYNTYGE